MYRSSGLKKGSFQKLWILSYLTLGSNEKFGENDEFRSFLLLRKTGAAIGSGAKLFDNFHISKYIHKSSEKEPISTSRGKFFGSSFFGDNFWASLPDSDA